MAHRNLAEARESYDEQDSITSYENDDDDCAVNNIVCDDTVNSEMDSEVEDTRAMFMKARMMSDAGLMRPRKNERPLSTPLAAQNSTNAVRHTNYASKQPAPEAVDNANDMVYKALMEHKKAEMQRMKTLASDTRTITEAMLRKQVCFY